MTERITLIGLYNYDPELFKNLWMPNGVDKQTFIDTLLLDYGNNGIIYANGTFMRDTAIPAWCNKWRESIQRVWDTLTAEYDPIENYDRTEEWTDSPDLTTDRTGNLTGKDTTIGKNQSVNSGTDTTEHKVSAYNASDYQNQDKTDLNHGHIVNDDTSATTDSTQDTVSKDRHHGVTTHKGRIHGNIGVTTNQQMIRSELELRLQTFYGYAVNLFLQDLLIGVW